MFRPPGPVTVPDGRPLLFLAGSIDMGGAPPWQEEVIKGLADLELAVLNPRRDHWDSSWPQTIEDPRFREQVEWELDGLERADLVAFYFSPTGPAPITLLELGLTARSGRLIVCCPDGYWRKGNVEIVCARFGVPLVGDLGELVREVRSRWRG
ncbi:hypothetical protein GCM10010468_40980 [Actinocorallia longicatena]|uniref:Nucleoside 2-deoxyribosyltransferase-like protein n=1 Tax=Actinocorallia longicatena TaxID=111803 RepID=A0ABP6QDD5_9ACTN